MSRFKMSLICEALAGSQLNWHRQEKNQPICRGLIRSLAAWSKGHWMIWSLFIQKNPWSWRSQKYAPPWWGERAEQFLQMTNYMLRAWRKRVTEGESDRQKRERARRHNLYLCDSKARRWKVTSCQDRFWCMLPTDEAAGRYTVG